MPQLGHYRSGILGLDLAIIDDNLRFLSGEATLPVSADLIGRLQGMMVNLEAKADRALAEGLREGLLALLDARGVASSDEARTRIESCAEPSTLRLWLSRAKTAASVDEVLSEAPPTA